MRQTLVTIYERMAQEGALRPDPAQHAVLPVLEAIRDGLEAAARNGRRWGGLFARPAETPRGLYLWGGVGRGKSMLMDLFLDQCRDRAQAPGAFPRLHAGGARRHARGAQDRRR